MGWFRRLFGSVSRALIAAAIEVAVAEVKENFDKSHKARSLNAVQVKIAKSAIDEVAAAIENELARRL